MAEPIKKTRVLNMSEIGSTGLKRMSGYVYEEFLKTLEGTKANTVYREMSNNDAVIGSVLGGIKQIIQSTPWRIEAGGEDKVNQEAKDFIESCFNDMSFSFSDFISEALSMLEYGWSWFEIIYKYRGGDVDNPKRRSKYDDNKIGWRKFAIRSQDSLQQWIFDDEGGITAMEQNAPPAYQTVQIPIEKSLLFRSQLYKNNPEGRSILRSAYKSYFFKKRIEELEAIGIERDLAGLPMMTAPEGVDIFSGTTEMNALKTNMETIVRETRRDQRDGIVLNFGWDFKLLSAAGSRQFSTNEVIHRYSQNIAMSMLAQFILLGTDKTGSFALGKIQKDIFLMACNGWASVISDTLNRYAIPRLLKLNPFPGLKVMPFHAFGKINSPDLAELGEYINKLSGAMLIQPDGALEDYLRANAGLPEKEESNEPGISTEAITDNKKPIEQNPKKPEIETGTQNIQE